MNKDWEIFEPESKTRYDKNQPQIRIYKSGVIGMTKAAHMLISQAERVNLLFNLETGSVGIMPDKNGCFGVRAQLSGIYNINAFSFCGVYGLTGKAVRYYKVEIGDGFIYTGEIDTVAI